MPFTRIIEHKHFESTNTDRTVISKEYSSEWKIGDEPYYPVNDEKNNELYNKYNEMANKLPNVIFGGRLGEYKLNYYILYHFYVLRNHNLVLLQCHLTNFQLI